MSQTKIALLLLPVFWPKMPPLGLALLKSYLSSKKIEADIFDLNAYFYNLAKADLKKSWLLSCNADLEENIINILGNEFPSEFNSAIEKLAGYDLIGFSCFKSNYKATLETAKRIKSKNKSIKILFGGPEMARRYFKAGGQIDSELTGIADMIVIGEGEKPISDYLSGKADDKAIAFEELKNLDGYPIVTYEGFDFSLYPRKNALSLFFSRGCLRRCCFCSEKLLYKKFRQRDVDGILDEIAFHKRHNGISDFIFHDSMLNSDLKALEAICNGIIARFGAINWEAQVGVRGDMDIELLQKMKKSGCYNLFVGLESGCSRTLKQMNKGFTPSDALDFFNKLKSSELNFGVSLIVGYPSETEEDFKESLSFILENKDLIPKVEQVNPFVYYDGTDVGVENGSTPTKEAMQRLEICVDVFKKNDIRFTNAFIGNLLEKR